VILKIGCRKNKMDKKEILEEKIKNFNPNENGLRDHGVFGLPFGKEESKIVLVPIPWEATVSYHGGTSDGPKAILDASQQIDLYNHLNPDGWKEGIAMQDIPTDILYENKYTKEKVSKYMDKYGEGEIDKDLQIEIDNACISLNNYVKDVTSNFLKEDKIVGVIGGDHSVPLGYLQALSEKYESFGVLHIDAHSDLRESYQGLTYSHASIFYNVLQIKNVKKLVQVGIRDISPIENELINSIEGKDRITVFMDSEIKKNIFKGSTWSKQCDKIIKNLPQNVYISFDIDGLMPNLCPNSGTPVPGGFSIEEVTFLFEKVISSGRKIIGFDLCEVSPGKDNQWDGNVGSRILYNLSLATLKSQK